MGMVDPLSILRYGLELGWNLRGMPTVSGLPGDPGRTGPGGGGPAARPTPLQAAGTTIHTALGRATDTLGTVVQVGNTVYNTASAGYRRAIDAVATASRGLDAIIPGRSTSPPVGTEVQLTALKRAETFKPAYRAVPLGVMEFQGRIIRRAELFDEELS